MSPEKIDIPFDEVLLQETDLKFEFVRHFYNEVVHNHANSEMYKNWHFDFTSIHGFLDSQREIDFRKLTSAYNIECSSIDQFFRFVYGLEVFYSILLKGIAANSLIRKSELKSNKYLEIIDCSFFRKKKIINYCSPGYYTHIILGDIGLSDIACKVLDVINKLDRPSSDYDYVKNIFESIFDPNIRHSLGEFYTPDWLAEYISDTVVEQNNNLTTSSFLDPTCGSGTFLVAAINKGLNKKVPSILDRVFGFDINPLSVLAAKTNYLIQYSNYRSVVQKPLVIPIFNSDIINESYYRKENELNFEPDRSFNFYDNNIILQFSSISYEELIHQYSKIILKHSRPPGFHGLSINEEGSDYYYFIDRLFSVYIINSGKKFNYIIGNPPWVNWEYLPKNYKLKSAHIWQHYDLFAFKGMDSIFVKEDISVLITYIVLDKFLIDKGILGFVLKETLFKSPKQAAGFRKFLIKPTNIPLKPIKVDDLTLFKPFAGVNARVAVLFLKKNETASFPIPYITWKPKGKKSFKSTEHLETLKSHFIFQNLLASPLDINKANSNWITQDAETTKKTKSILGKNKYKARTGTFTGGANGIFWIEILNSTKRNVTIKNLTKNAKNQVEQVKTTVEKDYIFPMLTGKDLQFWNYSLSNYIICPHSRQTKMYPISQQEILKQTPLLGKYFEIFKETLINRKGFTSFDKEIHKQHYYAIQRVGDYTFSPFKVAWRYISKEFICSVITNVDDKYLGLKNVIPNEKIIYVSFEDESEAYFLCGLLSSDLIRQTIHDYMVGTQIGPNIIENLKLPCYNKNNRTHIKISELCKKGHFSSDKEKYLKQLNNNVSKLYF